METSVISLRDVSKVFTVAGNRVVALEDIHLDIAPREYVSIMGPSGSGKSTLLNLMGGVDRPSSGEVWLGGQRIDQARQGKLLKARRNTVSYVFQEARLLLSLTALENVMLPTAFSGWWVRRRGLRQRAQTILEKVGLGGRGAHRVYQLSGGEAQRVCIARTLMTDPEVILADEPTGNLDRHSRMEIVELFELLNAEGHTVVVVTHDPEVAERAKRKLVIHDGSIATDSARADAPLAAASMPAPRVREGSRVAEGAAEPTRGLS